MHPRVVGLDVSAADEHHRRRPVAIERIGESLDVGPHGLGKRLDPARRRAEQSGNPVGLQGPEVDAVRLVLQPGEREPVGVGTEMPSPLSSQTNSSGHGCRCIAAAAAELKPAWAVAWLAEASPNEQ